MQGTKQAPGSSMGAVCCPKTLQHTCPDTMSHQPADQKLTAEVETYDADIAYILYDFTTDVGT